jgi:hypothetical protein
MTPSTASDALWALGELVDDSGTTYISFRQDLSVAIRPELTKQFVVEWRFDEPLPTGLPRGSDLAAAQAHQRLVQPLLEASGEAVLALIALGNGFRELHFYCRDPQVLQKRFNEAVAGATLPVTLHAGHDPNWRVFEGFVAPLRRNSTPLSRP